jgi:MoaA/NifB/PqqE/SkfB family radical SAM enzyme
VTYKCNSKCRYCNIWRDGSLKNVNQAKHSDVKQNIRDLKKIGVKLIDFTGGEPLLNNELPQMLQFTKEQGFFVKLSTNGLLYSDRADEIKGNVDRIYFSLDTTSRNDYNKIRGVDGFDKVIEGIEVAKILNQEICLLYTATNENIKNIEKLVDFCQKKKVMIYIHPCFSYFGNKALGEEYVKTIKKYFWKPYVRMNLNHMNLHYRGGNSVSHPLCKVGKASFDISPDNCVLIPCFQNQQDKIPINGDLFSLYNSDRWKEAFRNGGRYPFCEHCSIECNFGFSYWNRLVENIFLQNLSYIKNVMVYRTVKKDLKKYKRNKE